MHKQTTKLALHVISGAAYGRPFDWETADEISPGHKLSYNESLRTLVSNLLILFIFPRWMLKLPFTALQRTGLVYSEFGSYLQELVNSERNREEPTRLNSVLKALVNNSADTAGPLKEQRTLTDEELVGNAFVILLGGHESTYEPLLPRN